MKKSTREALVTYNVVIGYFIDLFIGMALGYFLGRYLDKLLFEDKNILQYVLLFLGLFSALINFVRRIIKTIDGGKKIEEE